MNKLQTSIVKDAPARPPRTAIPYFVVFTRRYPTTMPMRAQIMTTNQASHCFVLCYKNIEYIRNVRKNVTNINVMKKMVGLISFLP